MSEVNSRAVNIEWQPNESMQTRKVGLWVFMGVVTSLFMLLMIAFIARTQLPDWQSLAEQPWGPFYDSWQLWLNTSILMASSMALQWAWQAARNGHTSASLLGFYLAGVFTVGFLLSQLMVWQTLSKLGYIMQSNPANSFFYLLTAMHGLHLLGGLIVWGVICVGYHQERSMQKLCENIALCKIYWHFLLVLWLVLFALLTSSSDTYRAIASMCGF